MNFILKYSTFSANRLFLFVVFIVLSLNMKGNWTNLNTGINDDLTSVVFWGDNGVVSGEKGLYYTTTGGVGASSWTRFNVSGNSSDSLIYNNTSFSHCYSKGTADIDKAYVCGYDTVNNKAVVGLLDLQGLTFNLIFYGAANSKLNEIAYSDNTLSYYAVGDDGLVVEFTSSSYILINSAITDDLLSISILNDKFLLGSVNKRFWGSNMTSFSYSEIPLSGTTFEDVEIATVSSSYAIGTSYYSMNNSSNTITEYDNYDQDFGTLNPNAIINLPNLDNYIGTDHGIFVSVLSNNSILQIFPNTMNYSINNFCFDENNNNLFACGNDGVLLLTSNFGGNSKPYIGFDRIVGGCTNSNLLIRIVNGTGYNCDKFIDGVPVSSTCGNFYHTFNTAGVYDLELRSYYGSLGDTSHFSINIVDKPEINLPTSVDDSILCRIGAVTITIDSSQHNVKYRLLKQGSSYIYGTSLSGNGGPVYINATITETGQYYIEALSTIADCSNDFTDLINITVENTTAGYHHHLINAELNEDVVFYENCLDAQNYQWMISAGASSLVYSDSVLVRSFGQLDSVFVKLICWSDDGCYDTIIGVGPTIYNLSSQTDSCWSNLNNSTGVSQSYRDEPDISCMSPSMSGFFVSGKSWDVKLNTQNGSSSDVDYKQGYMAKYSHEGVLKWKVFMNEGIIKSVQEDSSANVYITGSFSIPNLFSLSGFFFDNTGDSVFVDGQFIIKLDSKGAVNWVISSKDVKFGSMSIDNFGKVYSTIVTSQNNVDMELYKDGSLSDTIMKYGVIAEAGIVKFSPNGDVLWDFPMYNWGPGKINVNKIDFDSLNNIYMTGTYTDDIVFYHPNSSNVSHTMDVIPMFGYSGDNIFVVKIDSSANFVWSSRATSLVSWAESYPYDMVTDVAGNVYITGRTDSDAVSPGHTFVYEDSDGTLNSKLLGVYFVAKINKDGKYDWIEGSKGQNSSGGGFSIDISGNELSILGSFSHAANNLANTFTGANGTDLDLPLYSWNYFIAVYDTAGHVLKIHANDNPGNIVSYYDFSIFNTYLESDFLRLTDGTYTFGLNGSLGAASTPNFGDTLGLSTNYDGFITHFKEGCGITYYNQYSVEENVNVCPGASYVFPDQTVANNILGQVVHESVLTSLIGIDSVVTTYIDTASVLHDSVFQNVCIGSSYVYPDGFTEDNILDSTSHISNLTSIGGCDSIVSVFLVPQYRFEFVDSICEGSNYVFPDGFSMVIDDTTNHLSYYTSMEMCDSILSNTVYPIYATFIRNYTICKGESFMFPNGVIIYDIDSTFVQNSYFSSIITGCDSIIKSIIHVSEIDTSITQNGAILSSNELNANYRWMDCIQMSINLNETNNSFSPIQPGYYAVEITTDYCVDTSSCYYSNSNGQSEINLLNATISPNPSNGMFQISLGKLFDNVDIRIFDAAGSIVFKDQVSNFIKGTFSLELSNGVYHVVLSSGNYSYHLNLNIIN